MANLRTFEGMAAVASVLGPGVAGLAGLLPAAFTPAGFAVFVTAIVAIGVLSLASWFFMDEMIGWWDDNQEAIVCALYESGTSVEAVAALGNFLEDAIQAIVTWGALAPIADQIAGLLSTAFSQLAGNGVVQPLFEAIASVVSIENPIDCDVCGGGGAFAKTRSTQPYNVLVVGDFIDAYAESETLGYLGQNSGQNVDLEFHVDGGYTGLWEFSFEFSPDETEETNTAVVTLQVQNGEAWDTVETWTFPGLSGVEWNLVSETDITTDLEDGEVYRFHMAPQDFNQIGLFRKFEAKSSE
jgi:hypothetical protein